MSNGWYNTADAKPLGGFEISIIGNITGFKNKDDKKSFILDPADYENLDFVTNPGQPRAVSTAAQAGNAGKPRPLFCSPRRVANSRGAGRVLPRVVANRPRDYWRPQSRSLVSQRGRVHAVRDAVQVFAAVFEL